MRSPSLSLFLIAVSAVLLFDSGSASAQESSSTVDQSSQAAKSKSSESKLPEKNLAALRVGVTQITSSVDLTLSTGGWQQELVNNINFLGGHGIIIPADPNDRDTALEQAKQQGCDYVVFTNVTNFKTASVGQKLGSVLGRGGLGGVGGSGQGRVELDADAKVFQPDNVVPILDGNESFRQNDPDATAKGLMHVEARDVMLQLKKLQAAKSRPQTSAPVEPPK